jgi:hypothetical protein
MDSFMFPATAAIMLATQTWLDDTGIADALSTFSWPGAVFFIKSRKDDAGHHYRVEGAPGGFLFEPVTLGNPRCVLSVLPPF